MSKLELYLNNIVGKILYKEDKKELIDIFNIKDYRGRLLKSIGSLNAYLNETKLPFEICDRIIQENKKRSRVWIVQNKIINK